MYQPFKGKSILISFNLTNSLTPLWEGPSTEDCIWRPPLSLSAYQDDHPEICSHSILREALFVTFTRHQILISLFIAVKDLSTSLEGIILIIIMVSDIGNSSLVLHPFVWGSRWEKCLSVTRAHSSHCITCHEGIEPSPPYSLTNSFRFPFIDPLKSCLRNVWSSREVFMRE